MSDFTDQLQPASFRGVPFGVLVNDGRFGRRLAPHEYPYKDKPWAEDLGRATRRMQISGFLITDSALYGGGDVLAQQKLLIGACETKGSGTLVHPTLGNLTVSIPEDGLVIGGRWETGRYLEFTLSFIESGEREFPSNDDSTTDATNAAADQSDIANALDFVTRIKVVIAQTESVVARAVNTVTSWIGTVTRLANDATGLFNMLVDLPGNFGRYFTGRTTGFATSSQRPASNATIASLIDLGISDRAAVATACDVLVSAANGNDANALTTAADGVTAALLNATANPGDAVRVLGVLFDFYPVTPTPPSQTGGYELTIQIAIGALLRRSTLGALARATALYQPASADDAAALRSSVADLFQTEIETAGDNGDDNSYIALRALRAAIVLDLDTRGAGLPELQTVNTNVPLPALVLAQRLYQDAGRSDELVTEADPAHPAFMPTSFKALGS